MSKTKKIIKKNKEQSIGTSKIWARTRIKKLGSGTKRIETKSCKCNKARMRSKMRRESEETPGARLRKKFTDQSQIEDSPAIYPCVFYPFLSFFIIFYHFLSFFMFFYVFEFNQKKLIILKL